MRNLRWKTTVSQFAYKTTVSALVLLSAQMVLAAKVSLSGTEETPPVTTSATGEATISVSGDKVVTGEVRTKGVTATAAHIHLAPSGQKGPPVITLTKVSDDVWSVPSGAKLTDEQYESYKSGNLYVNVHSAENKGGELRGQLKP